MMTNKTETEFTRKETPDRSSARMALDDPLQLRDKDPANAVRFARAAPHPDVVRIYDRMAARDQADSIETRLLLLTHLMYVMYRDVKETFAL